MLRSIPLYPPDQVVALAPPPPPQDRHARMRAIVAENGQFVARTLRRAGVPPSDIDDEVQRTFIIVADRLESVRPGAERSFLFQVAHNVAAHARRALARRHDIPSERVPERIEAFATPENLASRKQTRQLLDAIVGSMDEALRAVFVLYELEEMNLSEIARTLRVPRGTVASRLRRARAQFRKNVAAIELAWDVGAAAGEQPDGPTRLRRSKLSSLAHVLLGAGLRTAPSSGASLRTLSALGLDAPQLRTG